jgi:uncharacterized protein YcaQ
LAPRALILDRKAARRLSVLGQRLSGPRPASIQEVVHDLWEVQMDPTSAVARTEHLVLFSRLGRSFRVAELERLLWDERSLFEYWVHIVPTADYAIHRESMRRYPDKGANGALARRRYIGEWLRANAGFRRYVLRELRAHGPLRARDLEDRAVIPWRSGGWNDDRGRSVAMMLDLMWDGGEIMIVGRDGQQRLWDLAERSVPVKTTRLPQATVAREILERQLRARGVSTVAQFGWAYDGRPPGWERALKQLVREGIAIPTVVEGVPGAWFAHAELLEQPFRPRTVLLSPFDDLVSDRDHTEALFDFFFRLEIYVPKANRRWGYFVLPILHGDRLIGRIDPRFDRRRGVLHVNAVFAEDGAPASAGPAVATAIRELAGWLGAQDIAFTKRMPASWRGALTG